MEKLIHSLQERMSSIKHLFRETACYLGFNPEQSNPETVFTQISRFVDAFRESHRKNLETAERAARAQRLAVAAAEDKRKRLAARRQRLQSLSMYPSVFGRSALMRPLPRPS